LSSVRPAPRKAVLDKLRRVGRAHGDATVLFHASIATRLGLHPTDYKALRILERLGPLSAGDIAGHCGLATASVTNLIDRLEERGFVRRVRDEHDRRRVWVEPVLDRLSAGRGILASTRASWARLVDRYSTRDLTVIADFLERNAERLRDETSQLAGTDDGKSQR
jgi:DNA-binding MarR family transcriptional regulator